MFHQISRRACTRACAAWLCAALAGVASAQAPADAAAAFDAARADYERNHWDQAYAAFAALADQGHAEAARLAWQMWRYGPVLYRRDFPASAFQRAHWVRAWRCGADDAPERACQAALTRPAAPPGAAR